MTRATPETREVRKAEKAERKAERALVRADYGVVALPELGDAPSETD
jgi:hypothetical protein